MLTSTPELVKTRLPRKDIRAREPVQEGLTFQQMNVADWIMVENNKHQRDTREHLPNAPHLHTYCSIHSLVHAAQLPDGTLIKLDGHTRALLWSLAPHMMPPSGMVMVVIEPARDREHAAEKLYHQHDNPGAVDTARDDLSGAFAACGFKFKSKMLGNKTSTAIKSATLCMLGLVQSSTSLINIYQAVPKWLDELRLFDQIDPSPSRFPSGMVVAVLLTLRRRGAAVLPIWQRYQLDEGVKDGQGMDGAQALDWLLHDSKYKGGSVIHIHRVAARAVAYVEAALADRIIHKKRSRGIDLEQYCKQMRRAVKFGEMLETIRETQATKRMKRSELRKLVESANK